MEKEPIPLEAATTATTIPLKPTYDVDDAMKAFADYDGESLIVDEATNKRLLRNIDRHLMPVCANFRHIIDD